MTARSKAWVCGNSLVGFVGSNPARSIDVCLSVASVVCCQVDVSARVVLSACVYIVEPRAHKGHTH